MSYKLAAPNKILPKFLNNFNQKDFNPNSASNNNNI